MCLIAIGHITIAFCDRRLVITRVLVRLSHEAMEAYPQERLSYLLFECAYVGVKVAHNCCGCRALVLLPKIRELKNVCSQLLQWLASVV